MCVKSFIKPGGSNARIRHAELLSPSEITSCTLEFHRAWLPERSYQANISTRLRDWRSLSLSLSDHPFSEKAPYNNKTLNY